MNNSKYLTIMYAIIVIILFSNITWVSSSPLLVKKDKSGSSHINQPGPVVDLLSGFDGSVVEAGDEVTIGWTSYGGTNPLVVKLEYSLNGILGDWFLIKDNLPANGSYKWTVPSKLSYNCFIEVTVTDSRKEHYEDWNEHPFQIWESTTKGWLKGRVTDNQNHSIANAKVYIADVDMYTFTSENGSFIFLLPPYTYTIEISKSGYITNKTCVIVVGLGNEPIFYNVQLTKEGNITPTVMAGIAIFILFIIVSLIIFYSIFRKRMREYEKRRPSKRRSYPKEDELEDADKYWKEEIEKEKIDEINEKSEEKMERKKDINKIKSQNKEKEKNQEREGKGSGKVRKVKSKQ